MHQNKNSVAGLVLDSDYFSSFSIGEIGSGSVSENDGEFPDTSINVAHVAGET